MRLSSFVRRGRLRRNFFWLLLGGVGVFLYYKFIKPKTKGG